MNKHPHEEVILAYYRGEQIEWRFGDDEKWRPVSVYRSNKPGMEICPSFDYDVQYRIKPKTFTLVLNRDEMDALHKAIHYYTQVEGNDDSIDSLNAKVDEAEKNA